MDAEGDREKTFFMQKSVDRLGVSSLPSLLIRPRISVAWGLGTVSASPTRPVWDV